MAFKPNPGCDIPAPKAIPNAFQFLTDLPGEIAKRLFPDPTAKYDTVLRALKKTEEQAKRDQDAIAEQIKQYANIVCPLPDVLDKKASGRE